MPAKKKTVTEVTEVEETKEAVPTVDYRVVSESEVPEYVLKGYKPVGGVALKYGCWYQAVMKES